jgi:hypothetical protein
MGTVVNFLNVWFWFANWETNLNGKYLTSHRIKMHSLISLDNMSFFSEVWISIHFGKNKSDKVKIFEMTYIERISNDIWMAQDIEQILIQWSNYKWFLAMHEEQNFLGWYFTLILIYILNIKLRRYWFRFTRGVLGQIMFLQWCSGRKSWNSEKEI